jgi:hypothetical protein
LNPAFVTSGRRSAVEAPRGTKSPVVAAALSILFPGMGHVYIGMFGRAIWIFLFTVFAAVFSAGTLYVLYLIVGPLLAFADTKKKNQALATNYG